MQRNQPRHRGVDTAVRRRAVSLAMLIVYYGFILLVAFNKPFLATRLGAGVTTIGMPIGLAVIVFTVVITGIYVQRANREYDTLAEAIAKSAFTGVAK